MIRPLTDKAVTAAIKNGQFFIRPLKKANKKYKEAVPKATYNAWVVENENQCFVLNELKREPKISIVVPAYNTEPSHFLAMVYSVVNQHYDNWELVIVNASNDAKRKAKIAKSQDIDTRIKIVTPDKNLGIAGNTNFGLKHCEGEYVAFLDHDDLLHGCALHSIASVASKTNAGLIYTDEDKIKDDSSMFFEPFFKPRWSPDLFENVNYINHLTAVRREYVDKVDGLRPKFDGAQDYELLLRVIDECRPRIEHISRVLYHWRAAKTSTANDFSAKDYVLKAGEKALDAHLKRLGVKGAATAIKNMPGFYETLPETPKKLSIVIGPTDPDNHRLCAAWLKELGKMIPEDITSELVAGERLKAYKLTGFEKINYVKSRNAIYWSEAAKVASQPIVLCFGVAAMPNSSKAIAELAAQASDGRVFVSPFILGGKMILDAGLVESDHGKQRLFTGCELGDSTYYGYTGWVRNVAGLTLDVFATSRDNFVKLTANKQGVSLTDIDLDKVKEADSRLIVNPRAAFNFRGALTTDKFLNNQYFNPQLTQAHTDLYIKVPMWGNLKDISERDNVE